MTRIGIALVTAVLVGCHGGGSRTSSTTMPDTQRQDDPTPSGGNPDPGPGGSKQGFACPDATHFVSPISGEVLASNELASLALALEPSLESDILEANSVQVEITAQSLSGGEVIEIASGDLRSISSPGLFEAKWDVNDVPPGDYLLHAIVSIVQNGEACDPVVDCLTVTINRAPRLVDMDLLQCQPGPDGKLVTIRARTFDYEEDPVDQFIWNAGDGSAPVFIQGTSGEFTHLYPSDTSQVNVWLTAYDQAGGQFFDSRRLDVFACQFVQAPPRNCGCTGMTVASTFGDQAVNRSQIYCAANERAVLLPGCARDAQAPAGSCAEGQVPVRCALGPTSPAGPITANQLGWAFEVTATLDQRSNDQTQCDEGQFVQERTIRERRGFPPRENGRANAQRTPAAGNYQFPGGGNFDVVASTPDAGVPVPAFGAAQFGADDYTEPGRVKRDRDGARPPVRHWYDQPRVQFNPADFTSMQQQFEFVSFVRGNLDTCWCRFRFEHRWTAANGRTAIDGGEAPTRVNMIAGRNCQIIP